MTAFLRMGGYSAYVWPCIGLAIVVLVWNVIAARRQHARARERALARAATGTGAR